jgi:3-oxoacyl-[acyl-carrier protein] reductase
MRTTFIGGASKGLGLGCSKALAVAGHRIVMCARSAHDLEEAAREVRSLSKAEVITHACDLSQKDGIQNLEERLRKDNITIDVLINNVGGPPPGVVTQITESEWEAGLDLLFRSTLRLYAMMLPGMRKRTWGRVINILSTTVVEPSPALAVSSVLRAGLASYAKLTAWEVARDGVTVNSIMPGGFLTARTEELMADSAVREHKSIEEVRRRIESTLPLGRFMDPIELGRVAVFLASDAASGITGALIPVDGGSHKSL